jgi:undecaprenyl-diphosphatase
MGDAVAVLQTLDRGAFLLINRTLQNPLFDLVMPALSNKWLGFLLAALLIPLLLARYGRRVVPVLGLAVLAVALSDLGANTLKHLIQRIRPCHLIAEAHLLAGCTRSFAMPSNHAANMFALAGVLWLGLPAWRWPVLILAAGVGYSRVYLGVHYPTDVIVGALSGLVLGWAVMHLGLRLLPARWRNGGVEAPVPGPSKSNPGAGA